MRVTISAEELARVLLRNLTNPGLRHYNLGFYPGTRIPLRKIPSGAMLTVHKDGHIEDEVGGWIADRFGPRIGARDTKAVFAAVHAKEKEECMSIFTHSQRSFLERAAMGESEYNVDATEKISREMQSPYGTGPRHLLGLKPMVKITPAGERVLTKFDGTVMGYVSKPLYYSKEFRYLKKPEHKTLVRLVLAGHMRVFERFGSVDETPHSEYHYVLRRR